MRVELDDWEKRFLLGKVNVDLLTYMQHHANLGLKPDEFERMQKLSTLSNKLEGKKDGDSAPRKLEG